MIKQSLSNWNGAPADSGHLGGETDTRFFLLLWIYMAGMFDNRVRLEIQQANDIVDVISEHVSLKKKGHEMVGLCPFHDDHKPSMNVSSVKQIFKCFACGAGGDVIKFVQMRENLSYPQALERLAQRAGIKLERSRSNNAYSKNTAQDKQSEVDPNRLAKVNNWAAEHFRKNLQDKNKGKLVRDYLSQRQISPESIDKWRLGLAADSTNDLIEASKPLKIPTKLLELAGLITRQNSDKFINRLMFTITDVTGRVIGFGGRTLDGTGAKYINSPATVLFDKSNSMYGLEQARHEMVSTGTAVIVEGYTDCIMAHQAGCQNVVATLGTSFTSGHGRILRRYVRKVVLIFDSDTAGVEAANRALDVCLSQKIDIKIASVPEGKDPCDFILAAGKEGFDEILENATDVFQYKWDRLKEKFEKEDTISGKKLAIEEYLQALAIGFQAGNVPVIESGLIVNQISKIIGIDTDKVRSELRKRIKQAANSRNYDTNEQNRPVTIDYGRGRYAAAQKEILEVLLNQPGLYESVKQKISVEFFDVPILKQVANILFEAIMEAGENVFLKDIIAQTESVELSTCITELSEKGEEKGNFEIRLADAINILEKTYDDNENIPIETSDDKLLRYKNRGTTNRHTAGMY